MASSSNDDYPSESETQTEPNDDSSDEELNRTLNDLRLTKRTHENPKGKWLSSHPWGSNNKPDPDLEMKDTVDISSKYPIDLTWAIEGSGKKKVLNLEKIVSNLPMVVESEMKGSVNGSRQELEQLVIYGGNPKEQNLSDLSPHIREIVDIFEGNGGTDKKSLPENRSFKAISLKSRSLRAENIMIFHVNCKYMLKMHVPRCLSTWFKTKQCELTQWITKIAQGKCNKRWIFTPSFRRAKIALLDWPQDGIVNDKSTIRILVVRPSEFEEYVKYCGHLFPVICLPQDEIGAGYSRYWIQNIALRLGLQFIWMIDDSVECFYEYHPDQEPHERQDGKDKWVKNYRDYRRRQFGLVFKRIEDFVEEAHDNDRPIAAMSPRRWNPISKPKKPFSCMPPQGAVYLNLRALSEKNVCYRPELKTLEDMVFGYECEQKGLKVFRDNRILLQDHRWTHTGASSPSVKTVNSTASTALVKEIETKNLDNKCVLL